jgi:hypothetical protein
MLYMVPYWAAYETGYSQSPVWHTLHEQLHTLHVQRVQGLLAREQESSPPVLSMLLHKTVGKTDFIMYCGWVSKQSQGIGGVTFHNLHK